MRLRILLPYKVFDEREHVTRLVADTREGSMGLLPHRLDVAATLTPGILTFEVQGEGEVYTAVSGGLLLKCGSEVTVCVRHAVRGVDLARLRETVEHELGQADEQERTVRSVLARLESGFIRRFVQFRHL